MKDEIFNKISGVNKDTNYKNQLKIKYNYLEKLATDFIVKDEIMQHKLRQDKDDFINNLGRCTNETSVKESINHSQ